MVQTVQLPDDYIVSGEVQNPPKNFTYTIPNNSIQEIYYDFRFARILSLTNAAGVTIRFGKTGAETDIIGAGIGYELIQPVRSLSIRNQSGGAITIIVSLSMARVYDDRLTVSSTLNINVLSGASYTDAADVVVGAGLTVQILPSNTNRKTAIISNLTANGTVIRVGSSAAGAARGNEVPIGGTASLDTQGAIYVYNPSGSNINIGNSEIS